MKNTMTLVQKETNHIAAAHGKVWREAPVTTDVLFRGKDAAGRSGWFLRLTISGLYPRRIGPYRTKADALKVLEWFLSEIGMGPFIDLENDVTNKQAYVVEGVPTLKGRCS